MNREVKIMGTKALVLIEKKIIDGNGDKVYYRFYIYYDGYIEGEGAGNMLKYFYFNAERIKALYKHLTEVDNSRYVVSLGKSVEKSAFSTASNYESYYLYNAHSLTESLHGVDLKLDYVYKIDAEDMQWEVLHDFEGC